VTATSQDEIDEREEMIRKTKEILEQEIERENRQDERREEMIRKTKEILEREIERENRQVPVQRSGKRGRCTPPQELPYPPDSPPSKKDRKGWSGRASSSFAQPQPEYDELGEYAELAQPEYDELGEYAELAQPEYDELGEYAELAQPEYDELSEYPELAQPEYDEHGEYAELAQPEHDESNYANLAQPEKWCELDEIALLSMKIDVQELRYSQKTCGKKFKCERALEDLVQDLLDNRVALSDPFLRLSVFEERDPKTHEPILRCKDNRRLYALKQYAKKSGGRVMAHVNLFSKQMIDEVKAYIRNSDDTDGRDIVVRQGQKRKNTGRRWR